jgi:hypothetical protein
MQAKEFCIRSHAPRNMLELRGFKVIISGYTHHYLWTKDKWMNIIFINAQKQSRYRPGVAKTVPGI